MFWHVNLLAIFVRSENEAKAEPCKLTRFPVELCCLSVPLAMIAIITEIRKHPFLSTNREALSSGAIFLEQRTYIIPVVLIISETIINNKKQCELAAQTFLTFRKSRASKHSSRLSSIRCSKMKQPTTPPKNSIQTKATHPPVRPSPTSPVQRLFRIQTPATKQLYIQRTTQTAAQLFSMIQRFLLLRTR